MSLSRICLSLLTALSLSVSAQAKPIASHSSKGGAHHPHPPVRKSVHKSTPKHKVHQTTHRAVHPKAAKIVVVRRPTRAFRKTVAKAVASKVHAKNSSSSSKTGSSTASNPGKSSSSSGSAIAPTGSGSGKVTKTGSGTNSGTSKTIGSSSSGSSTVINNNSGSSGSGSGGGRSTITNTYTRVYYRPASSSGNFSHRYHSNGSYYRHSIHHSRRHRRTNGPQRFVVRGIVANTMGAGNNGTVQVKMLPMNDSRFRYPTQNNQQMTPPFHNFNVNQTTRYELVVGTQGNFRNGSFANLQEGDPVFIITNHNPYTRNNGNLAGNPNGNGANGGNNNNNANNVVNVNNQAANGVPSGFAQAIEVFHRKSTPAAQVQ